MRLEYLRLRENTHQTFCTECLTLSQALQRNEIWGPIGRVHFMCIFRNIVHRLYRRFGEYFDKWAHMDSTNSMHFPAKLFLMQIVR